MEFNELIKFIKDIIGWIYKFFDRRRKPLLSWQSDYLKMSELVSMIAKDFKVKDDEKNRQMITVASNIFAKNRSLSFEQAERMLIKAIIDSLTEKGSNEKKSRHNH